MKNNILKIIEKKALGQELTKEEIFYVIDNLDKEISDIQLSSFLMAVKIKGFSEEELFNYTDALVKSGKVNELDELVVDKHSTGGIGDKTTLILLPIFKKLGIKFKKISGKGLGFTGGTIDKLLSIENLKLDFSFDEQNEFFENNNFLIAAATKDICPADSKIYGIRDISGTVNSYDLIAASIMSKKIVSGAKHIFIDLKIGKGAMVKNLDEAKKLSSLMRQIAKKNNRELFVLYSNMNQPLGRMVGNSIELLETIKFLKNPLTADENLYLLIEKIVTEIYSKVNDVSILKSKEVFQGISQENNLLNEFIEIIDKQGGDISRIENEEIFSPNNKIDIYSEKDGYFNFNDISNLGYFLIDLKAGRKQKDDKLYYHSGVEFFVKSGDKVSKGDKIATIYSEKELLNEQVIDFKRIYNIEDKNVKKENIILGEETW